VVENWNWPGTRKTVAVDVYTNCPSAALSLNGKALGEKQVADRLDPVLHWDVPNEPGVLRATCMREGQEAARFELATAGAAHRFRLSADRTGIAADGEDVANVEIDVVDAEGRRVEHSDAAIEVSVSGAGTLAALDSGDLRDTTAVQSPRRKVYQGRALAIVRAGTAAGPITLSVSGAGLQTTTLTLSAK
jgi:beta-galactosidase